MTTFKKINIFSYYKSMETCLLVLKVQKTYVLQDINLGGLYFLSKKRMSEKANEIE